MEKGDRVPLCYYVPDGSGEPRFGLITGERVVDIEASGGPPTLASALQLPLSELQSNRAHCQAKPRTLFP